MYWFLERASKGVMKKQEVYKAYELQPDEVEKLHEVSTDDQELADYNGFPEIQAQIIVDRREHSSAEIGAIATENAQAENESSGLIEAA